MHSGVEEVIVAEKPTHMRWTAEDDATLLAAVRQSIVPASGVLLWGVCEDLYNKAAKQSRSRGALKARYYLTKRDLESSEVLAFPSARRLKIP
jgi:hypothetical protein